MGNGREGGGGCEGGMGEHPEGLEVRIAGHDRHGAGFERLCGAVGVHVHALRREREDAALQHRTVPRKRQPWRRGPSVSECFQ